MKNYNFLITPPYARNKKSTLEAPTRVLRCVFCQGKTFLSLSLIQIFSSFPTSDVCARYVLVSEKREEEKNKFVEQQEKKEKTIIIHLFAENIYM
jgi:hypothetical protein